MRIVLILSLVLPIEQLSRGYENMISSPVLINIIDQFANLVEPTYFEGEPRHQLLTCYTGPPKETQRTSRSSATNPSQGESK